MDSVNLLRRFAGARNETKNALTALVSYEKECVPTPGEGHGFFH